MKHRIIVILILVLLILVMFFSTLLKFPEKNGLCQSDFACEEFWVRGVFWPINYSLIYLISSLALLIFFPYPFLKAWLKIMIPYFVIAFIAVITTPALCGGMICFDRTLVATGLSKLFLILTILILISKGVYVLIISKRKNKIIRR